MKENTDHKKKVSRRVILFVILLNIFAWAGWFVAQDGSQEAVDLGNLLWLAAPFLLTLLFRLFSRDWADFGIGIKIFDHGYGYLFGLLIFPFLIFLLFVISIPFNVFYCHSYYPRRFSSMIFASAGSVFIKNILEESAWRGYLTPKFEQIKQNRILNHLLVGLIWGTWHIPYYLGLVDSDLLKEYTYLDLSIFIPLVIISMVIAGILFGELRLKTNSIWPGVIMHTVSNLFIVTILTGDYLLFKEKWAILFTPSWEGLIMMTMILISGLWLRKKRLKSTH